MENYELKKGKSKHLTKVVEIAKEGKVFCYPRIFYAILAIFGWLYVVVKDEQVIGYFCYVALPIINRAFFLQIGITEQYRGQGLGTHCLESFCEHVETKYKITTVWAHTLKPRVVKLLQRQRWKIIMDILGVIFFKKKSLR